MDQKTLIVLRHAKSWDAPVGDHERDLNDRGRLDALAVGRVLTARGLAPDVVACSTALRTRQTWDGAVAGGATAGQVRYLDAIYLASAETLLGVVRSLPESAGTALLLGHAPGMPDLVGLLARPSGDSDRARLEDFPTAGLAILTLTGPWAEAEQGRAELVDFLVPRATAPK